MENSVKRKINIFGKVAKIITTIIIVCLLVAEGFMLVGGIIVAIVPKDSVTVDVTANADASINTSYFGLDGNRFYVNLGKSKIMLGDFGTGDINISNSDGKLSLSGGIKDMRFDLNTALQAIICGMLSLAAIITALYFFKALMKEFMTCDSPFTDGIVKKMRAFAIALIPCAAVIEGTKAAVGAFVGNSFSLNIDLVTVAFVLIIFVLTMVFKYGAMLQKEHDETV